MNKYRHNHIAPILTFKSSKSINPFHEQIKDIFDMLVLWLMLPWTWTYYVKVVCRQTREHLYAHFWYVDCNGRKVKLRLLYKICGGVLPFAVLLSLGIWQVLRLQEKLFIERRMKATEIKLPGSDIHSHEYSQVELTGVFQDIYFRVFAGKNGYYLAQPMLLADGRYILVNRGTFLEGFSPGVNVGVEESVRGVLYCKLKTTARWVAANNAQENIWFWYDIAHMSKEFGKVLQSCIVWGNYSAVCAGLKSNKPLKIRNDHLEYAITWFVLAAVWIGGYACFLRECGEDDK